MTNSFAVKWSGKKKRIQAAKKLLHRQSPKVLWGDFHGDPA